MLRSRLAAVAATVALSVGFVAGGVGTAQAAKKPRPTPITFEQSQALGSWAANNVVNDGCSRLFVTTDKKVLIEKRYDKPLSGSGGCDPAEWLTPAGNVSLFYYSKSDAADNPGYSNSGMMFGPDGNQMTAKFAKSYFKKTLGFSNQATKQVITAIRPYLVKG